ncbi:MAG: DNRLRE domain-containing protein, partial [Candidatus Paceibacterota bacterium]
MKSKLSFFVSIFLVALVISVSLVQLIANDPPSFQNTSLGAQAADFSSGISVHAITPTDDAFLENGQVQNTSVLKVQPGSQNVYLKFTVSGVSAPVSKATLYLTQVSDAGEGTITVSKGAHSNWTENNLTSTNRPAAGDVIGSVTDVFENSETYAIEVEGVTGNGTYTFVLGMEEGGNDAWFASGEASASSSRLSLEVETGGVILPFEAENSSPRGSFTVESISSASNGGYLVQPTSVSNTTTPREDARLSFNLAESGEYSLWVRMYAPSPSSDAFYTGFNGSLSRIFPNSHGGWVWKEVARTTLGAGGHRISIGPGESGLRVDMFAVVRGISVDSAALDEYFSLESGGVAVTSSAGTVLRGVIGPLPPEGNGLDGDYYVATNGSDSNSGTIKRPLATLSEAESRARAGDIIYFRAGTYKGGIFRDLEGTASNP